MSHRFALAGVIFAALVAAAPASAANNGGAQAPIAPDTPVVAVAPATNIPEAAAADPIAITALVDPAKQQQLLKRTEQLRKLRVTHNKLASKVSRLSGSKQPRLNPTPVIADPAQAQRALETTSAKIKRLRGKVTYWTSGPGYWTAQQRQIPAGTLAALHRVAGCESGMTYSIATGNGFYGAYQFDYGTWIAMGGSGTANQASAAEQDVRAFRLFQSRGWAPWPVCGANA